MPRTRSQSPAWPWSKKRTPEEQRAYELGKEAELRRKREKDEISRYEQRPAVKKVQKLIKDLDKEIISEISRLSEISAALTTVRRRPRTEENERVLRKLEAEEQESKAIVSDLSERQRELKKEKNVLLSFTPEADYYIPPSPKDVEYTDSDTEDDTKRKKQLSIQRKENEEERQKRLADLVAKQTSFDDPISHHYYKDLDDTGKIILAEKVVKDKIARALQPTRFPSEAPELFATPLENPDPESDGSMVEQSSDQRYHAAPTTQGSRPKQRKLMNRTTLMRSRSSKITAASPAYLRYRDTTTGRFVSSAMYTRR